MSRTIATAAVAIASSAILSTAMVASAAGTPPCTMHGTPGDDTIDYIPAGEVYCGHGGDDSVLNGNHGVFVGGPGSDYTYWNDGTFYGGPGLDWALYNWKPFIGGPGNDEVWINNGKFVGGPGYDVVHYAGTGTFEPGQQKPQKN